MEQPREHPVPCKGCGYKLERGRPAVKTETYNKSGYCDDCTQRGIPESRHASRLVNSRSAAQRHRRANRTESENGTL